MSPNLFILLNLPETGIEPARPKAGDFKLEQTPPPGSGQHTPAQQNQVLRARLTLPTSAWRFLFLLAKCTESVPRAA